MPEFFNVLPPADALEVLLQHFQCPDLRREALDTTAALDRVLGEDIVSPEDLPAYPRSAMDGFAVRARDTFGASEGQPAYFEVTGEVPMGTSPKATIATGEAARAFTGGMLAQGADAVVMVENTQVVDDGTIEVVRPVAPGENVIQVGEDIRVGDLVLERGHILRPQDVGALLALGITQVKVARRPRVAIVSTGDELVGPRETPGPGQIRDINSYTVGALVESCGGTAEVLGIVPDDRAAQQSAAARALELGDILVFSAGSSVGTRDMTADVINSLGKPGVLVHGISLRPGKPAILGLVDGKPAFGLPGNPVSAMIVFDLLVRPVIYLMAGCPKTPQHHTLRARLLRDIASAPGREDYVQVRLVERNGSLCADPVFGKSNLIYTLVRADASVKVPLDVGGLYAGEEVAVTLH